MCKILIYIVLEKMTITFWVFIVAQVLFYIFSFFND